MSHESCVHPLFSTLLCLFLQKTMIFRAPLTALFSASFVALSLNMKRKNFLLEHLRICSVFFSVPLAARGKKKKGERQSGGVKREREREKARFPRVAAAEGSSRSGHANAPPAKTTLLTIPWTGRSCDSSWI